MAFVVVFGTWGSWRHRAAPTGLVHLPSLVLLDTKSIAYSILCVNVLCVRCAKGMQPCAWHSEQQGLHQRDEHKHGAQHQPYCCLTIVRLVRPGCQSKHAYMYSVDRSFRFS